MNSSWIKWRRGALRCLGSGAVVLLLFGNLLAQESSSTQSGVRTVEIVAHRGASFDAPENTLSAIKEAWSQQADAVEFDVWLTADGQIVLHHDADTERTAGVARRIDQQTLAELRELEFGKWKAAKYDGEPIATLAQALQHLPEGRRALIEVKCGAEIATELSRVLDESGLPTEQTAIISFSAEVCAACKQAMPELKVYWIVGLKQDTDSGAWNHTVEELTSTANRLELDGLDLQACELIDAAFARKVREARLELIVWTVNDPKVAKQMIAAGVQGITTDRPGWLREQLANE